jgi:hemoglobin/transferrin/lactoferrin receptor protein
MNWTRLRCLFSILILVLVSTGSVWASPAASVKGRVVDESGAVIVGAVVTLFRAAGTPVASATTDGEGWFVLANIAYGRYELVARQPGLESASRSVEVTGAALPELVMTLRVGSVTSYVTVTASRGLPEDAASVPNGLSILTPEQKVARPALILPQLLREEPGLQIQQTTSHQGAVLVRGLTGQQVLHLIDGVRYNNSTFRPGPNQYLATVDPSFVERLEVSRGPNSMQYGSDSLGGTLNLLPPRPFAAPGKRRFRGEVIPFFRSADLAGGSSVRLSYGTDRWYLLGGGSYRRGQDLRAGDAGDSHAAVTRFLGLPSSVLGERLQDTAFTQWASYLRFFWNVRPDQTLSVTYHRGEQLGGRRYDQLNGGNGNLINSFDPQVLDFFYTRYEKRQLGWLDSLTGTLSFNRQRDDRFFQGGGGNPLATITTDDSITSVLGYQVQATTHIGSHHVLLFGGEAYDEFIDASAGNLNPATGARAAIRGRFPNDSRYTSFGTFAQHSSEWFGSRLRTQAGVRFSGIRFRTFADRNPFVNGQPTVPDFSTSLHDVTFQSGASYRVAPWVTVFASFSRGFRAPNTNDYSAVGLTSNGFEVSPEQARTAGGFVGTTAGNTAVSTGQHVTQLAPETLFDIEGGARVQAGRFSASVTAFQYNLSDFITKRTLILPAGAVGQTIGGAAITQQLASGAVLTALDPRPVITRANIGEVRIRGVEVEGRVRLASAWLVSGNASYLRGIDRQSDGAPDIEGGLPPVHGIFSVRWQPAAKPFWMETFTQWSDKQARLSSLELSDQRIGAIRSRSSIASFFINGATARGLVAGGILLPTGETLAQVQDRVLGAGVTSAPLFTKTPGFATLNFRGGYRMGENQELVWVFENVLDRNYRVHGSGVDSPGRNLQLTYILRF